MTEAPLIVVYQPGDEMHDGTVNTSDEPVEVVQTWPTSEPEEATP